MATELFNPATGKTVTILSDEERKAKQNLQYKNWRAKLETSPAKLEAYRARKNEASKRFHENRKALIAEAKAKGLI